MASRNEMPALARKLKRTYEIMRRKSTPKYSCGAKFDDVWFKLANLVSSLGACPVEYMEAQFETWGGTPFPPQLCSRRSVELYEPYRSKGVSVGKLEFEHQVRLYSECRDFYKQKYPESDQILGLDFVPLKPYIRVCLCSAKALPGFLEKYGREAAAEIRSSPSLEKYLKENYVSRYERLFPQGFSEGAGGPPDTLPGPSRAPKIREGVPKRRRLAHP